MPEKSSGPVRATPRAPARTTDAQRAAVRTGLAHGGDEGVGPLDRLTELTVRVLGTSSARVVLLPDLLALVRGTVAPAGTLAGHQSTNAFHLLTLAADGPVVVEDAAEDPRLAALSPDSEPMTGAHLGVPLAANDGRRIGALCVHEKSARAWTDQDVTLLEQLAAPIVAELELAALSAEYEGDRIFWQLAVDAGGIGAFDWDLLTGELHWDDRLIELFGLDRDTFGGSIDAFYATLHPEDLPRVTEGVDAAISACGEFALEYRVLLPHGGVRWIAARGRALPGPDGSAARLMGAAYDTTAVQEGEARVARVLEAMPTAFFHLDREWRFRYVNAEAQRLLGATRAELVGQNVWELFPAAVGSDFDDHYRRALDTGVPVSFDAYYPPPLDSWYEVRAWPTPDGLWVYFNDVTDRRLAQDQLDRAARRNALLARVAGALTGTLDADEGVTAFAQSIVPDLADWCIVSLVGGDGHGDWRQRVRDVGWWHAEPEQRPLLTRYARRRLGALTDGSFLARALSSGLPVVVPHGAAQAMGEVLEPGVARDLLHRLDPASAVVLPLLGRDRTVGLVSVFRGSERETFSEEDREVLTEAATRAGLAIDNARLYAEQRDLAEGLQRSLMTAPPEPDHLQIAVRYEPAAVAAQVGGDWYDAFLQQQGDTVIVIGDVVGHDTAAAAAMGQMRSLLRGIAVHSGGGPADVLRGVDQAMETLVVGSTATAVVARFEQTEAEHDRALRRMVWSNAGHPPPLVLRADGAAEVLLSGVPQLLLGFDPTADRSEHEVVLEPGSTVLLYTDGLVERRGQSLDDGLAELERVLGELRQDDLDLESLCDALIERLLPERPEDDVALVAVRLHPQDRPRPAEAGPRRVPPNVPDEPGP